MNVEDGTETALMETLEEPKLAAVGNPRLGAVQESSEYGSPAYTDFGAIFQVLVSPHTFVQPTNALFALASLLSISLSILASDEMMHPR